MHLKISLSKSFRISGSGIQSLLMICFLLFSGCYGPKNRCVYPLTLECRQAKKLWQQSIDNIVKFNFPEDSGRYLSTLWEDDFDNAWVTKGNEINITRSFLYKLNHVQRLSVAAHELAHLKLGHYYARMGIIIVENPSTSTSGKSSRTSGHYGRNIDINIPRGFGKRQEEEADHLAMKYIEGMGFKSSVYLDMLLWLQKYSSDLGPEIFKRIMYINKARSAEDNH